MIFQRISLGALCGALLCIASALSSEPSRSAPGLTETELKAVFLLRLPQFVTWPEQGLGRTFCVDEGSEVASLLSDMIAADPKGRGVLSLASARLNECDVVFSVSESLQAQGDRPQLWVSDAPGFALDGGMVELKRRGVRMGLVVNVGALRSVGLSAFDRPHNTSITPIG